MAGGNLSYAEIATSAAYLKQKSQRKTDDKVACMRPIGYDIGDWITAHALQELNGEPNAKADKAKIENILKNLVANIKT